jgi:hypothetical protein
MIWKKTDRMMISMEKWREMAIVKIRMKSP